jgi:uncharacterized protein YlzI (FlbEa/FlbD family)
LITGWNFVLMNSMRIESQKVLLDTTLFLIHPNKMV